MSRGIYLCPIGFLYVMCDVHAEGALNVSVCLGHYHTEVEVLAPVLTALFS